MGDTWDSDSLLFLEILPPAHRTPLLAQEVGTVGQWEAGPVTAEEVTFALSPVRRLDVVPCQRLPFPSHDTGDRLRPQKVSLPGTPCLPCALPHKALRGRSSSGTAACKTGDRNFPDGFGTRKPALFTSCIVLRSWSYANQAALSQWWSGCV